MYYRTFFVILDLCLERHLKLGAKLMFMQKWLILYAIKINIYEMVEAYFQ